MSPIATVLDVTLMLVIGSALTVLVLNGGAQWDAVVVGYFFAGLTLWWLYGRRLAGRLRLR